MTVQNPIASVRIRALALLNRPKLAKIHDKSAHLTHANVDSLSTSLPLDSAPPRVSPEPPAAAAVIATSPIFVNTVARGSNAIVSNSSPLMARANENASISPAATPEA